MRLLIPTSVAQRFVKVLKRRGMTEIGGVLMGEHVSADEFRIVDFTVQRAKGGFASFLRMPKWHRRGLNRFFRRTREDYRKFNYLGEWHSHPAFSTRPSGTDLATMQTLVDDPSTGATFAVLMIVRLDRDRTLQVGTYLFVPDSQAVHVIPLALEADHDSESKKPGMIDCICGRSAEASATVGLISNPDVLDQSVTLD